MLAGLPYKAWLDGLSEERMENKKRIYRYNSLSPEQGEEQAALIKEIIGKCGENIWIETPFHCDYGWNIEVGENFFANYNLTILDVGKVVIGKNAQIAPNVSIYTAGHPVHPDSRNTGYEYGIGVTIGDNLPDDVIAVGNPCRVLRKITEEDRKYYFKDREFDVEDYK